MDTIGIIGAMEEEIEFLRVKIGMTEDYNRCNNIFYQGVFHGSRIILLKSGIGKVNAAIGTTLLIARYDPMCIINTGSAGGISTEFEIGDVIISSQVIHHDVDVTAFGYAYGQVPQMPFAFLPHSELVEIAVKAASNLNNIRIHRGTIATGDSFMNDSVKIKELKEKFPSAAATEMEAAAIAQTCHQFRKPFVVIRSISDMANSESVISFDEFLRTAADNSANMAMEIIRELREYTDIKESERMLEVN